MDSYRNKFFRIINTYILDKHIEIVIGETLMEKNWDETGHVDDDMSDDDEMFWGEDSDEI